MINWPEIKPLIEKQISSASGLPLSRIDWADEKKKGLLAGAVPIIWLRVSSIIDDGIPYEVRVDGGVGQNQMVSEVGQREFTLSARCESFTPNIADPNAPLNIIDRTKLRLYMQSAIDERLGAFAVRETLGTKWFNYITDNRPVFVCVVDFKCATVNIETDSYENGDYINEVTVNSVPLKNIDGNSADRQIALDIK